MTQAITTAVYFDLIEQCCTVVLKALMVIQNMLIEKIGGQGFISHIIGDMSSIKEASTYKGPINVYFYEKILKPKLLMDKNLIDKSRTIAKSAAVLQYEPIVSKYAKDYDVDPKFILALIHTESAGDTTAHTSKSTARGLMQMTEGTAAGLGLNQRDIFDPEKNIEAGVRHFANLLHKAGGDYSYAAQMYHDGAGGARWARNRLEEGNVLAAFSGAPVVEGDHITQMRGLREEGALYVPTVLAYLEKYKE